MEQNENSQPLYLFAEQDAPVIQAILAEYEQLYQEEGQWHILDAIDLLLGAIHQPRPEGLKLFWKEYETYVAPEHVDRRFEGSEVLCEYRQLLVLMGDSLKDDPPPQLKMTYSEKVNPAEFIRWARSKERVIPSYMEALIGTDSREMEPSPIIPAPIINHEPVCEGEKLEGWVNIAEALDITPRAAQRLFKATPDMPVTHNKSRTPIAYSITLKNWYETPRKRQKKI